MAFRSTKRGIAVGAATSLAMGALALIGTGVAGADSTSITWNDYYTTFTRTVSNATPAAGETITVTTTFKRTDSKVETITSVSDTHAPCLTYVPDSATMNGIHFDAVVVPDRDTNPRTGTATITDNTGAWVNKQNVPGPVFSVQYKVGTDCARGTALVTGLDYNGSLGAGYYGYQGPSVTAGKNATTTTIAPVAGAVVGKPIALTATVSGGAVGNPVKFYDDTTVIGQGTLDANGTATLTWTPATAGERPITVEFAGTTLANGSVGNATVSVASGGIGGGTGGTGSLGNLFGS
ncbi:Ig-like domain-containing protein [Rhodococcus sp. OK302]|uniref:Ig-like domain-containing protein n=1 Tax=Rhodococcus sp. OK302 TaxID=1882769 RepID=UPI000B94350A|nr:Ig-like domain-containing protein [Rhodococcus sp. OK302]OYD67838.1 putative repeat protein (TIGR01451 family) [Rhodococcus sp. OK302]